MNAALLSTPSPNKNTLRPALRCAVSPSPVAPREEPSALAAQDEDQGLQSYCTIDLPPDDGVHGPVRLIVEGTTTAQVRSSIVLCAGDEIVIGAAPDADLIIADSTVSARHCAVTHRGGRVQIVDLGSRNGIRIAGARVERALCSPTMSFEIGRCAVRIEAVAADSADDGDSLPGVIGCSAPMKRLAAAVRGVGALSLPVLLRGESGTGKDVIARAIHSESSRARRPFVVLNAATIRPELAESELFGHERGAFTGAVRERRGAFREAHGGTLFLDEIAALPLDVQAKLLRAVEQGTVRPLGGEKDVRVDVRLVAATCEPLEQMVRERLFRADLYERLAVCVLRVPALRERPDDIAPLARHLLATSEVGAREITPCAIAALRRHAWPGNVRELRNVLVQSAIAAAGPIRAQHVQEVLAAREEKVRRKLTPQDAVRIFEESGFNVSAAARRAELPRTTMRDLLCAAGAPLRVRSRREPTAERAAPAFPRMVCEVRESA